MQYGAPELTTLRGSALVAALEQIDPTDLRRQDVDLGAVVDAIEPAKLGDDEFHRLLAAVGRIADGSPGLDLGAIDANALARLVATATRSQLEGAMADRRLRAWMLDEIFRRMASRARTERIGKMHSVIRWRITEGEGPGGFDRYECVLSDGSCTVSKEMTEQPRVTITVSAASFVRLITQQETPAVLFVTGDLKVQGDLGFAAGLIGYFDLPAG